jgi:hypothetical protein
MERQEKINILMAHDIMQIREDIENGDYEFVCSILQGEGWEQYNKLTDYQIDDELEDRFVYVNLNDKIIDLANRLNGKPINLET